MSAITGGVKFVAGATAAAAVTAASIITTAYLATKGANLSGGLKQPTHDTYKGKHCQGSVCNPGHKTAS